jgi:CheY-like chemotaxis protein
MGDAKSSAKIRRMNRLPASPLVKRALDIAEKHLGLQELCARLGAHEMSVQSWRFGHAEMPHQKFLLLVDLLTQLEPRWSDAVVPAITPKRILIVDDHPDLAESLAELLKLDGHEAVSVVDARQALAVAKTLKPQLAMLDLRMPHIDGLELARLFRSEPELKRTCLVAITAETQDKFRQLTRHAGFDAYLNKPIDLAMLRSIVAQFGN